VRVRVRVRFRVRVRRGVENWYQVEGFGFGLEGGWRTGIGWGAKGNEATWDRSV